MRHGLHHLGLRKEGVVKRAVDLIHRRHRQLALEQRHPFVGGAGLENIIEDAGQSQASIAARFGEEVAAIVVDCTDTAGPVEPGAEKEPWLLRKTRYLASLEEKPQTSLLVTAADKAHNAGDMVLDARRDPAMWSKFNAGLEGSA